MNQDLAMTSRNKMTLRKRSAVGVGLSVLRYTRSITGKRVAFSSDKKEDFIAASEKQFEEKLTFDSSKTELESLPRDLLARIVCRTEHDDLKQLFHVSKVIREATILAKKLHFEFSTPTKSTFSVANLVNVEPSEDRVEMEAPDTPKQLRVLTTVNNSVSNFKRKLFYE